MDESARSRGTPREKSIAVFAVLVILVAALGAILVYYGAFTKPTTDENPPSTSSLASATSSSSTATVTSLSTMSISNSTSLSSVQIAATNIGGDLDNPVLDSNAGLIYGLSFSQTDQNTLLTAINISSLAARTVLTLPGTGLEIAIDAKTDAVYVLTLGCVEGVQVPNSCSSNPSGFVDQEILRVNGSTGAIEGRTLIQTNGSFIGVDPNTDTLYSTQTCPHPNPPCGRLLAFNATTGSLAQNLTVKAGLGGLVVNPVTGMVYAQGGWELPASQSGNNRTQGIVAFQYPPPYLQVDFIVPLNYTNTIDLSLDESTNVVYGFADNIVGNESSNNLIAVNGATGFVIFSKMVGTCSLADAAGPEGATVNTSTNQVYLDTTQGEATLVALDVATGQVVGMLPSPSLIDNSLFDSQSARVFVFLEGGVVAAIPSAVIKGGVNSEILNASCPVRVPL